MIALRRPSLTPPWATTLTALPSPPLPEFPRGFAPGSRRPKNTLQHVESTEAFEGTKLSGQVQKKKKLYGNRFLFFSSSPHSKCIKVKNLPAIIQIICRFFYCEPVAFEFFENLPTLTCVGSHEYFPNSM